MAGLGAQSFLAGGADPGHDRDQHRDLRAPLSRDVGGLNHRGRGAQAVAGLALCGWVGDVVHASSSTGLRLPAMVTFRPILPVLLLLVRLPESRGVELA